MKRINIAFHWQMAIALLLGVIAGICLGGEFALWSDFVDGVGDVFLHAINMIVVPLVFLSTVLGISTMGVSNAMGRIAFKSFSYFFLTAICAAIIGVYITDYLCPGEGTIYTYIEANEIITNAEKVEELSFMDRVVGIVPKNIFEAFSAGNILSVIFFSIMLGYFITQIHNEERRMVNDLLAAFNDVIMRMTAFIIRFAPIGVFAIVMVMVGEQMKNPETLMRNVINLAFFVIVVWISLIVMGGVILPLMVGGIARVSPLRHLKQIYAALMVAFSTSSSYSALPLILSDAKEKCGVSNNVAGFTVPLGITFNKIGTVIYECAAVIFVAQAVGVELTFAQQISLIGASIVTVLGAPSVPMAGVVVLAVLLNAMELPVGYVGMFMVIDVLCDMPKTLLNAYSVSCGAIIVAKSEGEILKV